MRLGKQSWRRVFQGLLVVGAVFYATLSAVPAWTLTTIKGREYVPLSEVQAFYEFNRNENTPETVKLVKPNKLLIAQIGTRDLFLNKLRFTLNLPIVRESGGPMISRLDLAKIVEPVLRPKWIRGGPIRTIVLDAGHGGNDQGTWSYYGSEKLYTLDVVARMAPILKAAGLNVVFTRNKDVYLSLEDRVSMANRMPEAMFVSIHFNAGADARGIETYTLTPAGVPSSDNKPTLLDFQVNPGNDFDPENMALATAIHGSMMQRIRLRDRGIRQARFHVLKGVSMPGVLIEGGYLGGADAYTIAHPQYRQLLAECISTGIFRYLQAVPVPWEQPALTLAPPKTVPIAPMAPATAVVAAQELPKPGELVHAPSSDVIDPSPTPQP